MSAALTTFVVLLSSTRGQIPVLSITPNPVEIGLNYTLVCQVEINHAIKFFFENNEEGGCDPPFFGGACSDTGILQDSTAKVTTWTRTANIGKEGNWTCRRETIDSDSLTLDMYECPDTVLSQSGINSNLVLNGSSKVDITARIACIYPTTNLDFQLQLIPSSGNTLSTNMTCIMTASSCTVGSAYDCNYQISDDIAFVPEIEYTVHVKAAPLSQPCDSLALFHPHTLTFESTGSTSQQYVLPCWIWIIIALVVIIILYVTYRCSNKNCKTYGKCWKCSKMCYSDYPLVTNKLSEEWNIEHYCCLKLCCPIKVCNKMCCSLFLCCGCCLNEFPAKRHTKVEKAIHTATVNNTNREPDPPGDGRLSLDSLNSKSNQIHPAEDKRVNNTKILDPIMHKPGNDEITHSSTPRPLPVLPPIDKKRLDCYK